MEDEGFKYVMAHEKMMNLLFTLEQTLAFFIDYEIKPDIEANKLLDPLVKQLQDWQKKK